MERTTRLDQRLQTLTEQHAAAVAAGDEKQAATLAWLVRLVRGELARPGATPEKPPARLVQTAR